MQKKIFSRIIATGGYLPKKILSNADLEKIVDTSDDWIRSRTGIEQRYCIEQDQDTSDIAYLAAKQALSKTTVTIDAIIVATCTADAAFPSVACIIQKKLGLQGIPAFDINAACSGFIYGLKIVDAFIISGMMQHILLVGADSMSKIVDYTDRNTCILFGDGAGAVVISASDKPGILQTDIYADTTLIDDLKIPGGLRNGKICGYPFIKMNGKSVFKTAVSSPVNAAISLLNKAQINIDQVDYFISHQANIRIINSIADALNIPSDKVIVTVNHHGNTSAASIPLALNENIQNGKIKYGSIILLASFGAGFTWGVSLLWL